MSDELKSRSQIKRVLALDEEAVIKKIESLRVRLGVSEAENERLRAALSFLLNDTQHSDHRCGDLDCPVENAKEALSFSSKKKENKENE